MTYAGGDWFGLLIFIVVVIAQIISAIVKASQKNKAGTKPDSSPQQPARHSQPVQEEEPLDPLDELMEALGKKPGQTPSQLPKQKAPSQPIPPLTPVPHQGTPYEPIFPPVAPKKQAPPVISQPKVRPLTESAPTMTSAQGEVARVRAEVKEEAAVEAQREVLAATSKIECSEVGQAASAIAQSSNAANATVSRGLSSQGRAWSPSSDLARRLRSPADLRRAIILNEVLGTPLGLK
jgi:hypothetical protein